MQFEAVAHALAGIPYTSPAKGKVFYDLVMTRRPRKILELGFAHGVSTCYFAAAAAEIGHCDITTVDLDRSRLLAPTIETLVARLGFNDIVTVHREQSSYTWFLKKEIAAQTREHVCRPKYDLVFIDGPKDWTNDGCAFFLADKLLAADGALLFDDYNWSYRGDEVARGTSHSGGYVFPTMSAEEFCEPQIRAVFELLVLQHPNYGKFEIIDGQLALALKTAETAGKELRIHTRYSVKHRLLTACKRMSARISG